MFVNLIGPAASDSSAALAARSFKKEFNIPPGSAMFRVSRTQRMSDTLQRFLQESKDHLFHTGGSLISTYRRDPHESYAPRTNLNDTTLLNARRVEPLLLVFQVKIETPPT
jgi:hypothetical protein